MGKLRHKLKTILHWSYLLDALKMKGYEIKIAAPERFQLYVYCLKAQWLG